MACTRNQLNDIINQGHGFQFFDPVINIRKGQPETVQCMTIMRTAYSISSELLRQSKDRHKLLSMAKKEAFENHLAFIRENIENSKLKDDSWDDRRMSGILELADRGFNCSQGFALGWLKGRGLRWRRPSLAPDNLYVCEWLSELTVLPWAEARRFFTSTSRNPFRCLAV